MLINYLMISSKRFSIECLLWLTKHTLLIIIVQHINEKQNQNHAKLTPMHFPVFQIISNSDWLIALMFTSLVIGWSSYFGFGFYNSQLTNTSNEESPSPLASFPLFFHLSLSVCLIMPVRHVGYYEQSQQIASYHQLGC